MLEEIIMTSGDLKKRYNTSEDQVREINLGNVFEQVLFPLNCARRLGGYVVHHPVDTTNLVDDPVRGPS